MKCFSNFIINEGSTNYVQAFSDLLSSQLPNSTIKHFFQTKLNTQPLEYSINTANYLSTYDNRKLT